MFSATKSRLVRTIGAGLIVAGLGVATIGGGAVHAQPKGNGYGGAGCYIAGVTYPEGTMRVIYGVTHICKDGSWVIFLPGGAGNAMFSAVY